MTSSSSLPVSFFKYLRHSLTSNGFFGEMNLAEFNFHKVWFTFESTEWSKHLSISHWPVPTFRMPNVSGAPHGEMVTICLLFHLVVSHAGIAIVSGGTYGGMVKVSIYCYILSHGVIANVSVANQGGMVKVSIYCYIFWYHMLVLQMYL